MRWFILALMLSAVPALAQSSSYKVSLTWQAPACMAEDNCADPVVGYDVYRQTTTGTYQKVNTSVIGDTLSYDDLTVDFGTTYSYYVVSVDAQGNVSSPSNTSVFTIPSLTLSPVGNVQLTVAGGQ